jgi:hypothetical protein
MRIKKGKLYVGENFLYPVYHSISRVNNAIMPDACNIHTVSVSYHVRNSVTVYRIQRYARPRSANMYCSLNGGIRQGLIEHSIGAPDQRWFYERAMGSTCGVHEVTYGQFSN